MKFIGIKIDLNFKTLKDHLNMTVLNSYSQFASTIPDYSNASNILEVKNLIQVDLSEETKGKKYRVFYKK